MPFDRSHVDQLTALVNAHIASVVPGWGVPAEYLAARLERDPDDYVVDPWVAERETLVAIERERIVAAAHLKRYLDEERVGPAYRGVAEIVWLVAWPDAADAGRALLDRALVRFRRVVSARTLGAAEPVRAEPERCGGRLAARGRALARGRLHPGEQYAEAVWGGWLAGVPAPAEPPLDGLTIRRNVANLSTRFEALLDGRGVAVFDVASDLTEGGALPCLRGWGDVWTLEVVEKHRGKGIGSWLVSHGVEWLRLAGCDRIVLPVAVTDEERGAGRFYERLGWRPVARLERGWSLS
jgi:GNAT superfamily N-acetyltransferase